jgi:hypothetical protein
MDGRIVITNGRKGQTGIEKPPEIVYSVPSEPVWRNWQTRGTQNPVRGNSGVGSIPSTGIRFPILRKSRKIFSLDSPSIQGISSSQDSRVDSKDARD